MGYLNRHFGISELASEHGEVVDQLLEFINWFMLLLFIGWSIFLIVAIWKFRRSRSPRGNYYGVKNHASTHIEVGVILTEAVFLLGFAYPLWSRRVDDFPIGEDVVRVRAVGEQFLWNFHYTGPDGKFGRVSPELMSPSNPLGIDHTDPNSKDDFASVNTLVIPLKRKVIVGVTAKDVIHNLALVSMRTALDATPGTEAHMWFTPNKVGTWDIVCGQLCGSGHGVMRASLEVLPPEDFETWFKEKTPADAAEPEAQQAGINLVPAIAAAGQ